MKGRGRGHDAAARTCRLSLKQPPSSNEVSFSCFVVLKEAVASAHEHADHNVQLYAGIVDAHMKLNETLYSTVTFVHHWCMHRS